MYEREKGGGSYERCGAEGRRIVVEQSSVDIVVVPVVVEGWPRRFVRRDAKREGPSGSTIAVLESGFLKGAVLTHCSIFQPADTQTPTTKPDSSSFLLPSSPSALTLNAIPSPPLQLEHHLRTVAIADACDATLT